MSVATLPLRVLVIEKQMLFAKAVAQVLSADPDIKVVGIASGRDSDVPKDVDIVVIDIDTEEIDDVVAHFKARAPGARICALSAHTQERTHAALFERRCGRLHPSRTHPCKSS